MCHSARQRKGVEQIRIGSAIASSMQRAKFWLWQFQLWDG